MVSCLNLFDILSLSNTMCDVGDVQTAAEAACEARDPLPHHPLASRETEPSYGDRIAKLGRLPVAAAYQLEKRARLAAGEAPAPGTSSHSSQLPSSNPSLPWAPCR